MKIQLDISLKKIQIEETVNLKEFFNLIEKLLPNETWKEFDLEVKVINNWINPIRIDPFIINPPYSIPHIPPPQFPWWRPGEIICSTNTNVNNLNPGTYNIEY